MLRLFYGIRCIMAHGKSDKTLSEGVLKEFPQCPKCEGNLTQITLDDSKDLVHYSINYTKKIKNLPEDKVLSQETFKELLGQYPETEEQDKHIKKKVDAISSDADYKIGRIPKKEEFEKLKTEINEGLEEEEWNDVFKIIESHFPTTETSDKLPASFAYFHLCRVFTWVKKKKDMYITYRLLNQFIHMLAFRIHIAVAEILIRKHGLPNGTWGIEIEEDGSAGNIDEMIEEFEKEHEKIVRDVHAEGKKRSSTNHSYRRICCKIMSR